MLSKCFFAIILCHVCLCCTEVKNVILCCKYVSEFTHIYQLIMEIDLSSSLFPSTSPTEWGFISELVINYTIFHLTILTENY